MISIGTFEDEGIKQLNGVSVITRKLCTSLLVQIRLLVIHPNNINEGMKSIQDGSHCEQLSKGFQLHHRPLPSNDLHYVGF